MPTPLMLGQRAVVLGASLAGLLAARVLSERFAEVVLLERDELPQHAAARKGTPHATHPHGLLARGREVLEALYPGMTSSLVARGGLLGDLQREIAFDVAHRRLARGDAGVQGIAVSRLAIEAEVRLRTLALPGVRLIDGVDIQSPAHGAGEQIVAARYATRGDDRREERLAADFVIDCTGRGSRTPAWLAGWGYAPPKEEKVDVGICYTSAYFKRSGAFEFGKGIDVAAVICAASPELPRPAVLLAQESDANGVARWVIGVGGYAGDHVAATIEAMRERAVTIGSPEILRLTHEAEQLGDIIRYTFPSSLRRRYERLSRFPSRYLALGDALTSFNPIYGQGMTVAACEALALQEALSGGLDGLHRRFFRAAAKIIDTPWQLAVGGDLAIPTVPGPRPFPVRLVNAYIARLQRVASSDALVSRAFLKVVHMLEPPSSLFSPAVLWRVLTGTTTAPGSPAHRSGKPVDPRDAWVRS